MVLLDSVLIKGQVAIFALFLFFCFLLFRTRINLWLIEVLWTHFFIDHFVVARGLRAILDFDNHALRALAHMALNFLKREYAFTETTLAERVVTIDAFMFDLLLFDDTDSTAFAYDLHEATLVKFVGAQEQLIIRQLVIALLVVTLKPDLRKCLSL